MAYSCVKVLFEIGHEASLKAKRTPEGYTHDWEVFVRGADNSDIFHFVDKVVFNLHETFQKPKRVVKEPPYSVKESGYAGFTFPIDIYFKNSDEPKKVRFNYDLSLQNNGPPIKNVLREEFVFPNPAEELRRRLIKGGGVGVLGSESGFHAPPLEKQLNPSSDETSSKHSGQTLVAKPKLSSNDPNKKHKIKEGKSDDSRVSNSFHDLFGPPIKTAKVSPDPKKSSSHSSPKVSPVSKSNKPSEKSSSDKSEKSSKSSKHSSQKEGKEPSEKSSSTKDEKKDKSKDKEKNKDKPQKRPSTPVKPASSPPKRPSTPPKRPTSSPKRPSSPSKLLAPTAPSKISSSPKQSNSSKVSKDEAKKPSVEEKNKSESKPADSSKSEKKKKDKKNRDEKPKKDKHKDHEKSGEKLVKSEKPKESKEKDVNKKLDKDTSKEPEKPREKEKEKSKHGDGDKEKQRHKHKKKDKSNKDKDREKEREKDKLSKKNSESKVEVRNKERNGLVNEPSRSNIDASNDISTSQKKPAASSPSPSPIRVTNSPAKPSPTPEKAVSNVPVRDKVKRPILSDDSSDSHSSVLSADEDGESRVGKKKAIKTSDNGLVPVDSKSAVLTVSEPLRPNSRSDIVKPKSENSSQERNSLNKSSSSSNKPKEKSSKKNKEKPAGNGDVEKPEKDSRKNKRKRKENRLLDGEECLRSNGDAPSKIRKLEVEPEETHLEPEPEPEQKAAIEEVNMKDDSESEEHVPSQTTTHLTEEYVSQLKELQHKIERLEDNAELQRVVQVIAETGKYEVTKTTFDFDLCALDRSTVARLQEFFAS